MTYQSPDQVFVVPCCLPTVKLNENIARVTFNLLLLKPHYRLQLANVSGLNLFIGITVSFICLHLGGNGLTV